MSTDQPIMSEVKSRSGELFTNPNGQSLSKLQGNIIIGLLVIALALALWNTFRPNTKWEYKIEAVPDLTFERSMIALGDDGWELVSARRASSGEGTLTKFSYEIIFKRPKW
jgi:hypothetical protein